MHKTARLAFLLLILGLLGFVACKGTDGGPSEPGVTSIPTEAATLVTDATPEATHVWEQPTTPIKIQDTPAAATMTPASADAKLIERGKNLYEKLECGKCHGDHGEGIPDSGSKLAGTTLTEGEFEDVLRTGGKGELGNEHLYGTSAISESGINAVYAFLQSLED